MKLIRLQDNTPDVYSGESRDFQLFCRLYDCVNNGFLYDASTISDIVDTEMCRSTLLPLLQTKVGFFGDTSNLDDRSLRMILEAYPYLIKHKGSLKAIKYAMNVFFKIIGVDKRYGITVDYSNYIITIMIESSLLDTTILKLILEPILPAGVGVTINYIGSIESYADSYEIKDRVKILYISDKYNSSLRGSTSDANTNSAGGGTIVGNGEFFNTRVGAVDSTKLYHPTSDPSDAPSIEDIPEENNANSGGENDEQ